MTQIAVVIPRSPQSESDAASSASSSQTSSSSSELQQALDSALDDICEANQQVSHNALANNQNSFANNNNNLNLNLSSIQSRPTHGGKSLPDLNHLRRHSSSTSSSESVQDSSSDSSTESAQSSSSDEPLLPPPRTTASSRGRRSSQPVHRTQPSAQRRRSVARVVESSSSEQDEPQKISTKASSAQKRNRRQLRSSSSQPSMAVQTRKGVPLSQEIIESSSESEPLPTKPRSSRNSVPQKRLSRSQIHEENSRRSRSVSRSRLSTSKQPDKPPTKRTPARRQIVTLSETESSSSSSSSSDSGSENVEKEDGVVANPTPRASPSPPRSPRKDKPTHLAIEMTMRKPSLNSNTPKQNSSGKVDAVVQLAPFGTNNLLDGSHATAHLEKRTVKGSTVGRVAGLRPSTVYRTYSSQDAESSFQNCAEMPREDARVCQDGGSEQTAATSSADNAMQVDAEQNDTTQNDIFQQQQQVPVQEEQLIPRSYQLEILDRAKETNIIAVLETGSGKTLIALLLLQHIASVEPVSDKRRISAFLVPTVPLVTQQARFISYNSRLRVSSLHGGGNGHSSSSSGATAANSITFWTRVVMDQDVIVMTPDILRHALDHGFVTMNRFNVVIFDECHHVRNNHPYLQIMRSHYMDCSVVDRPKIFDITASPVLSKESFDVSVKELERNMNAVAVTTKNQTELHRVIHKPVERYIMYCKSDFFCPPLLYERISSERSELIGVLGKAVDDVMRLGDDLGQWCAERALEHVLVELTRRLSGKSSRRRSISSLSVVASEKVGGDVSQKNSSEIPKNNSTESIINSSSSDCGNATDTGSVAGSVSAQDELRKLESDPSASGHIEYCKYLREYAAWGPESNPLEPDLISPKLNTLFNILMEFRDVEKFCGVVFVQQRLYASVIRDAICANELLRFITPVLLVGHGDASNSKRSLFSGERMTIREQQIAVSKFRQGQANVLIATQVAEEGLDIKPCNVVIRFDMTPTLINYIQSRGRARHPMSQFIVLVDEENDTEKAHLLALQHEEKCMREGLLRSMETDTQIETQMDMGMECCPDEMYRIEKTGAKLTVMNATSILYQYCATLPSDGYSCNSPEFNVVGIEGGMRYAEVVMPPQVPVSLRVFRGPSAGTVKLARRRTAFAIVRKLHECGELDDWLLASGSYEPPSEKEEEEVVRKAEFSCEVLDEYVGGNSVGGCENDFGKRKNMFEYCLGIPSVFGGEWGAAKSAWINFIQIKKKNVEGEVFPAEDSFDSKLKELGRKAFSVPNGFLSLGFLTIDSPAETPFSTIHISNDECEVRVVSLKRKLNVSESTLRKMKLFHTKLFSATLGNSVDQIDDFCILVVPIVLPKDTSRISSNSLSPNPESVIDWRSLTYCQNMNPSDLNSVLDPHQPQAIREEVVLVDLLQYERKFVLIDSPQDLLPTTPLSKVFGKFETAQQFYEKRLKATLPIQTDKPLLRGASIPYPLQPRISKTHLKSIYCVRDFCRVYPIRKSYLFESLVLPIVLRHVWHYALICDLKRGVVPQGVSPTVVSEVVSGNVVGSSQITLVPTTALKLSGEFTNVPVELLQIATTSPSSALPHNYERLETLGDAFLKVHQSMHLFVNNPHRHEGWLTNTRARIERNQALHDHAIRNGLQHAILSRPLNRKSWLPPSRSLAVPQQLSKKTLADVFEAVVGACVLSNGPDGGANAIRILGGNDYESSWKKYYELWKIKTNGGGGKRQSITENHITSVDMDLVNQLSNSSKRESVVPIESEIVSSLQSNFEKTTSVLESQIGYTFTNKDILMEALTHPSWIGNRNCYQRLEYLGDALLTFLVIHHLYGLTPEMTPGEISIIRSEIVSNQFLACVSVRLGLVHLMQHMSEPLGDAVGEFSVWVEEKMKKYFNSSMDVDADQDDIVDLFWCNTITAPKAAGDIYEALLGAVFLDSGFSLDPVQSVFRKTLMDPWLPWINGLVKGRHAGHHHPVSRLQFLVRSRIKCLCVKYTVEKGDGGGTVVLVRFHERVIGRGVGGGRKDARREAARAAVAYIEQFQSALETVCNCNVVSCEEEEEVVEEEEDLIEEVVQGEDVVAMDEDDLVDAREEEVVVEEEMISSEVVPIEEEQIPVEKVASNPIDTTAEEQVDIQVDTIQQSRPPTDEFTNVDFPSELSHLSDHMESNSRDQVSDIVSEIVSGIVLKPKKRRGRPPKSDKKKQDVVSNVVEKSAVLDGNSCDDIRMYVDPESVAQAAAAAAAAAIASAKASRTIREEHLSNIVVDEVVDHEREVTEELSASSRKRTTSESRGRKRIASPTSSVSGSSFGSRKKNPLGEPSSSVVKTPARSVSMPPPSTSTTSTCIVSQRHEIDDEISDSVSTSIVKHSKQDLNKIAYVTPSRIHYRGVNPPLFQGSVMSMMQTSDARTMSLKAPAIDLRAIENSAIQAATMQAMVLGASPSQTIAMQRAAVAAAMREVSVLTKGNTVGMSPQQQITNGSVDDGVDYDGVANGNTEIVKTPLRTPASEASASILATSNATASLLASVFAGPSQHDDVDCEDDQDGDPKPTSREIVEISDSEEHRLFNQKKHDEVSDSELRRVSQQQQQMRDEQGDDEGGEMVVDLCTSAEEATMDDVSSGSELEERCEGVHRATIVLEDDTDEEDEGDVVERDAVDEAEVEEDVVEGEKEKDDEDVVIAAAGGNDDDEQEDEEEVAEKDVENEKDVNDEEDREEEDDNVEKDVEKDHEEDRVDEHVEEDVEEVQIAKDNQNEIVANDGEKDDEIAVVEQNGNDEDKQVADVNGDEDKHEGGEKEGDQDEGVAQMDEDEDANEDRNLGQVEHVDFDESDGEKDDEEDDVVEKDDQQGDDNQVDDDDVSMDDEEDVTMQVEKDAHEDEGHLTVEQVVSGGHREVSDRVDGHLSAEEDVEKDVEMEESRDDGESIGDHVDKEGESGENPTRENRKDLSKESDGHPDSSSDKDSRDACSIKSGFGSDGSSSSSATLRLKAVEKENDDLPELPDLPETLV